MKNLKQVLIAAVFAFAAFLPQLAQAADTEAGKILNNLIRTERDAQDGYFASAQQAESPELKNLFLALSQERAAFIKDLESQVTDLGDVPADKGTAEGSVYRGWIDVKTALSTNDDRAVLAEVAKAESIAADRYNEALQKILPSDVVRNVVEKQAEKVRSAKLLAEDLASSTGNNIHIKDAIKAAKDRGLDVRGI